MADNQSPQSEALGVGNRAKGWQTPGGPEIESAAALRGTVGERTRISAKRRSTFSPTVSAPMSHRRPKQAQTANVPCRSHRATSAAAADLPCPATYVFQTLGYVETQSGELEAVVVDGERVYLIKQGERFGDNYRAISVDPDLVLAVRASPGWDVDKLLARQEDFGPEPASRLTYGTLHPSTSGKVDLRASREAVAQVGPHFHELGIDLINMPGLAGLDSQ